MYPSPLIPSNLRVPPGSYDVISNEQVVDVEFSTTDYFQYQAGKIDTTITQPRFRDDSVCVSRDSAFQWRALEINGTGTFSVRFTDSDGFYLSNAPVPSYFFGAGGASGTPLTSGDSACPFSLFPGVLIPKGGRIGVEYFSNDLTIQSTPATLPTYNVQLLLRGVKRYVLDQRISQYPAGNSDQDRYIDLPFWYYFQIPEIDAGITLPNLALPTDQDADFTYRSIQIYTNYSTLTLRLKDGNERYYANAQSPMTTLIGSPSIPRLIYPEVTIPAGGNIVVEMTNTGAFPNVVNLLFVGTKRYLVAPDRSAA